jgi:type II secretory pathway component HofQ
MVETSTREQLNISLAGQSALARQLREAEVVTGQPRAQIARSVLAAFLETWLRAEEARRQIIVSAKQAGIANRATIVTVHDVGHVRPPRRDGGYQPEPYLPRAPVH